MSSQALTNENLTQRRQAAKNILLLCALLASVFDPCSSVAQLLLLLCALAPLREPLRLVVDHRSPKASVPLYLNAIGKSHVIWHTCVQSGGFLPVFVYFVCFVVPSPASALP